MRIAALYDIHGNVRALEAVLAEVAEIGVDAVVVGGDIVAGPWARESIDLLRARPERVVWIGGNCERELLEGTGEALVRSTPPLRDDQLELIRAAPLTEELPVDGVGRALFCHATPRNDEEIFTELTPVERLAPVFAGVEADVVVCGHTHSQFEREVGNVRVVNAGSVGVAYEDEPGAYWLLLAGGVELRRTEYDAAATEADIAAAGFSWPKAGRAEAVEYFESMALGG